MYLQRLNYNEDVVHTDSQHQERNDFDHDEGEGDAEIAKNPQRGRDGAEHDEDSSNTQRNLRVHLDRQKVEVIGHVLFSVIDLEHVVPVLDGL